LVLVLGFALSILGLAAGDDKTLSVVPESGPMHGETVYTDSYALFIGIARFQNRKIPDIPCAGNDARTMRDIFVKKFGFNPDHAIVLENEKATKASIEREIHRLCDQRKVKKTDRVLVYFSCHGQEVPNPNGGAKGYIIPYDATIDLGDVTNPPQYQESCIEMESIGADWESCPARHRALIVDACFSGFALGTKGLGDGIDLNDATMRRLLSEPGLAILAAGTSKDTARGGNSETDLSAYTRALRDALTKAEIGGGTFVISQLAALAKERTVDATKGHQNPGFGVKDGTGEMILFPTSPSAPPVPPKPPVVVTNSYAGILNIDSEPSGAKVFVNGEEMGVTPFVYTADLVAKPSATVEVVVTLAGFLPSGKPGIVLGRGSNESMTFRLEAKKKPVIPKPKNPDPSPVGHVYGKLKDKARESGVEMVYIPGGSFQMGDDDPSGLFKNAKPVRTVTLSPYWLSKTPVTVAQFRAFTDDSGYRYDWEKNKPDWGWDEHPDYPMVHVSWDDAMAYCTWAVGTLPTEAQWERAAKGPIKNGLGGTKYPWGDEWNKDLCVNGDNSNNQPASVIRSDRMYETSEGLLDMAGNVWLWCRDWYTEEYGFLKSNDPDNTTQGQYRVYRGGSWINNYPENFRSAVRHRSVPGSRYFYLGFRLAGL
jgi:formylglycine-generating enzyme